MGKWLAHGCSTSAAVHSPNCVASTLSEDELCKDVCGWGWGEGGELSSTWGRSG